MVISKTVLDFFCVTTFLTFDIFQNSSAQIFRFSCHLFAFFAKLYAKKCENLDISDFLTGLMRNSNAKCHNQRGRYANY